jgi:hypothetical protein
MPVQSVARKEARQGASVCNPLTVHPSALGSYYRCPVDLLPQLHSVPPDTDHEGYFSFGDSTICYGRLAGASAAHQLDGSLPNIESQQFAGTPMVELPFDPEEVIENLRRERYAAHFREEGSMFNELLRKAYYLVRPCLSVPVRRIFQKIHLRGWEHIQFPAWPVDTTVEEIHKKLLALSLKECGLEQVPFVWFWPDGYTSCFIMTHDVEDQVGKEFCSRLMDLDEAAGIRSSFQVIPENRYVVTSDYLDSIKSRGFEVNVHDLKHDGRLYAEQAEFLRRAAKINAYAKEFGAEGFRSGILYRNADWYGAFDFAYDMSIPNVGHLDPQRGGCCTVLPYFIGNIVELPLTCTQDYTLFQIMEDYSIDLWKRQIDIIRKNNGLISFIVHPDYVIQPRPQSIYKELLDYMSQLRAGDTIWSPLPHEVASWWRRRNQLELVHENGDWRVNGPGSERARVGYAILDGDSVVYRLVS